MAKNVKGIVLGPVIVSVILPGLGQFAMGMKKLGATFMGGALGLIVFGLFKFVTGYMAYMDMVLGMDPNVQLPDPWAVMHLRAILFSFASAIVIHGISIGHAIYYSKKQEDSNIT